MDMFIYFKCMTCKMNQLNGATTSAKFYHPMIGGRANGNPNENEYSTAVTTHQRWRRRGGKGKFRWQQSRLNLISRWALTSILRHVLNGSGRHLSVTGLTLTRTAGAHQPVQALNEFVNDSCIVKQESNYCEQYLAGWTRFDEKNKALINACPNISWMEMTC